MLKVEDIKKFWKYIENTFEKDEIESVLDAYEFERKYLKDENATKDTLRARQNMRNF